MFYMIFIKFLDILLINCRDCYMSSVMNKNTYFL